MPRKKTELTKIVNGVVVKMTPDEIKEMAKSRKNIEKIKSNTGEPLDRSRITDDVKKQLIDMVKELPHTKCLAEILLGSTELEKLMKE